MHEHKKCEHELKYCEECDLVFCKKCKKEWVQNTDFDWRGVVAPVLPDFSFPDYPWC
jgi:hypothetical protein